MSRPDNECCVFFLSSDGLGERLRGDRHADAAGGKRRETVLPLLA